jgi:hypothetical protein
MRAIGPLGTAARILVGAWMLGSVIAAGLEPLEWALGLVAFPAVLLAWQWLRARRTSRRLVATGPVGHALTIAVFLALYLTPRYASDLVVTSDAALIFFGLSMLLAATRGYSGCEVLAVSNWLLRRDDQVGCVLFAPIDQVEQATARSRSTRHDARAERA